MSPRIAPLSAAALVALGAINVWLLAIVVGAHEPEAAAEIEASAPQTYASASPPAGALPPPKAYRETLARPVFYKSRAPFVPPPPPPPPQPPKAVAPPQPADPGLQLAGVAISGGASKAYLVSRGNAEGVWVAEGEALMGWTVKSIDSAGANLRQRERELRLELYPVVPAPTLFSPKSRR